MVPYIPPELAAHILSSVPYSHRTETLLACTLVCRAWRPLAQQALIRRVSFRGRGDKANEQATQLAEFVKGIAGGWKCESVDTSGISLGAACTVFEAAASVQSINLHLESKLGMGEYVSESRDVFGFGCMAALERLTIYMAPIPPTQAKLPRLRELSVTRRCGAEPALPSILGAAPNLQTLDLTLEHEILPSLLKVPFSALKHLTNLRITADPDTWEGQSIGPLVPAFVGGWCPALKTIFFGLVVPEDHLALLKKVNSKPTKIGATVLMLDSSGRSTVGSTLKKMAGLKGMSEVKEWNVFVEVYPGEERTEGPVERAKWEDKDWRAWIKMCEGRGIELKVNDNLDQYNEFE